MKIVPVYNSDEAKAIVNQKWVIHKLKSTGVEFLKPEYRSKWSTGNPTYGYCYIISELLYHYVYVKSVIYHLDLSAFGEDTHWFLKEDGKIIDFTGIQFSFIKPFTEEHQGRFFDFSRDSGIFQIPYPKARRGVFFEGKYNGTRGFISDRAVLLGERLGLLKLLEKGE